MNIGDRYISPKGNLWTVVFRADPNEVPRMTWPEMPDGEITPPSTHVIHMFRFLEFSRRSLSTIPHEVESLTHVVLGRLTPSEDPAYPELIITTRPIREVETWKRVACDFEVGDKLTYAGEDVVLHKLLPALAVLRWAEPFNPDEPYFVLQRWTLPFLLDGGPLIDAKRNAEEDEI